MKRIVSCILAAAICAQAGLFAQENEPSEDYVLQQARDKYSSSNTRDSGVAAQQTQDPVAVIEAGNLTISISERQDKPAASASKHPYTPFVLSFVPGLSSPFGIWDTSLSLGSIGSITGSVYGLQVSGVFNIADGDIGGFQGAGVFNIASGSVNGFQGAGVFNMAEEANGFQGAGVFNMARKVSVAQLAGVFNIADELDGVQAAGVLNIADKADGVMAAGVINVAGKAKGVMIAPINVADELDGLAIGFLNFIGNGIHDLSVDYQFDTDMTYLTYRSGTPQGYAVFYAGQPASKLFMNSEDISIGAGLGHRLRILFLTADLEACVELPIDPDRLYEAAERGNPELLPWSEAFGSLRVSFGFGQRRGFGAYFGIKTDVALAGSGQVPLHLRSSYGESAPRPLSLFGENFELWPKLFIGIKF
ncbi:MAG TPA: hypothetical protein DCG47_10730 [Spirochaetaceae bacterium]|nr:hypothetical protein [Spirochaetaceae bacterium]